MGLTEASWEAHYQSLVGDVGFTHVCRLALVLVQHACACADRASFRHALTALQTIRDQGGYIGFVELASGENEDDDTIRAAEEEYAPRDKMDATAAATM